MTRQPDHDTGIGSSGGVPNAWKSGGKPRYLMKRWTPAMETQVNVAQGDGEPVAGKRNTFTTGTETWWNIRIPHDAATTPTWEDYPLTFPLDERAEGIGVTGWDWQARRSRDLGFDFDAIAGHTQGLPRRPGKGQAGGGGPPLCRDSPQHRRQGASPVGALRRRHCLRKSHRPCRACPLRACKNVA